MDTEYLKTVPTNTVTRELTEFADPDHDGKGNVYESTMIIAKRANAIAGSIKSELDKKLKEFAVSPSSDAVLEETSVNKDQIDISRVYEKLPKPTLIAIKEFEDKKIYYRMSTPESFDAEADSDNYDTKNSK
jgi:DNA-directed RNA polymerase subunit K/omega